jgi:hypothetical protein
VDDEHWSRVTEVSCEERKLTGDDPKDHEHHVVLTEGAGLPEKKPSGRVEREGD